MNFTSPDFLYLLLLIPVLVLAYIRLIKSKNTVVKYSDISLIKQAVKFSWFKRHGPPLLLLIAIILSIVAISKPEATVTLPFNRKTYIVTMDTSGSMMAEDMSPTRVQVMKNAVTKFIKDNIPYGVQIGLVAFSNGSTVISPPTANEELLVTNVSSMFAEGSTAMGDGLLSSLNLIFPKGSIIDDEEITEYNLDKVVHFYDAGKNNQAVIILLSDGDNSVGIDPIEVARVTAKLGIRVYTIGLGTSEGMVKIGETLSRAEINEDLLKQIANITRGQYWKAENESTLKKIYGDITSQLIMERRHMDITYVFAALSALFMIIACSLSMVWSGIR